MKVLHVITSLRTGGAEKLMVELLPRLKARGIDTDLLLFDGIATPFRRAAEEAGVKIMDLGEGGSVYSLTRLFKLLPYLKRYDIVHTHNTAPQLFAAIGSLLCPAVLCTTEHTTSNRRRNWEWYAAVDRWMYSRYEEVICVSQKTEDNLRHFIGTTRTNICIVENGVDISQYAAAEASTELERIAPGSRKMMMVAGFRGEKDQDTLIRALNDLPENFHLFFVGDGIRRSECEALAATCEVASRTHFLGLRDDVPRLLHAADYVIMSSHFEGLSLSSIEGMSVGRPFLASDVDGLHDVVEGAGVLFPHGDAAALVREIMKLEADGGHYAAVARACGARAARYDIHRMAESYIDVYRRLLRRPLGRPQQQ